MTDNCHNNPGQAYQEKKNREYAADQKARDYPTWFRDTVKYWNYQWFGPVYRRIMRRPPSPFLVICHSRTGSNFLLWLLASHPRILHIGEPFGTDQLELPWVLSRLHEIGAASYLKESLQRKGNESVVAFKLQYEQLEPGYAETWNIAGMEKVREFIHDSRDLKVIHLKRRNRLQTLASLRLAEITKTYVLFNPNKRVDGIRVELTPEECEMEFSRVAAFERRYDELFSHHRMLEVCYETLVADTRNEGERIQDFLGVKWSRLREQTVRQNVRRMQEVVKNYAELKAHFANTPWEGSFDA